LKVKKNLSAGKYYKTTVVGCGNIGLNINFGGLSFKNSSKYWNAARRNFLFCPWNSSKFDMWA